MQGIGHRLVPGAKVERRMFGRHVWSRRLAFACSTLLGLSALAAVPARAQGDAAAAWPKQPIRLLVGFAAGGGNDLFGRLVAQKLSEKLGQPVVVEISKSDQCAGRFNFSR